MENPINENPIVKDEVVTEKDNETIEPEIVPAIEPEDEPEVEAAPVSPPPTIDYLAKKLTRDAKSKRKDEKTVQQVLKSLDNLKTPEEKLSAMCKKYSELLHENRQYQSTLKQCEKQITLIHREKEQFRHERSKAVLAKTRMEQLCRELQKLNKNQQEETALKLRVEEEKRKEICLTFQSAFAEMNTLTNQNNEKSAKMREENMDMREKIKSVRERIELTELQLDKVREQAKLELELAREKLARVTLELTAEKEALMEDKRQLLMKLATYHVQVKEHKGNEQCLVKQIKMYEEKFQEFQANMTKTTMDSQGTLNTLEKNMANLGKETARWKQRWEKTNIAVIQLTEIKEKRDVEMAMLNNKLTKLQELCKAFQRERASLMAQLRDKKDGVQVDRKHMADENRKSLKQVENITKDCEKLKDNLSKLEGSFNKAVREVVKAAGNKDEAEIAAKGNKKFNKKTKNEARKKSSQRKQEPEEERVDDEIEVNESVTNEETSPEKDSETSGVFLQIAERQDIVLEGIEKASSALRQAVLAGFTVKQSNSSTIDTVPDDNQHNNEVLKVFENLPKESKESEIVIPESNTETEKLSESSPVDKTRNNSETSPISMTEFEIVHHGPEPDTATCDKSSPEKNFVDSIDFTEIKNEILATESILAATDKSQNSKDDPEASNSEACILTEIVDVPMTEIVDS